MAMLTKASKLLSHLSRCSSRSMMDKTESSNLLYPYPYPYPSLNAHFSTNRDSNRPFRGDRRGRRDDDETEFLQNMDFGYGANGERSNPSDRNQNPPPPPPPPPPLRGPNRQWRGERSGPPNREFPTPPFQNSNRQLGRETRSRGVDPDDFFRGSRKETQLQRREQPMKERFRDLSDSDKDEFEKSSFPLENEKGRQNWRAKALGGTGETLFEKLRLGDKQSEPKQTPEVPQTPPATNNAGPAEPDSSPPPPQEAEEIFRKMKETGLIPNAVAMLDGLCKDGLVQEAMKLFGVIREKGTIPEVVIYTAVVEAFCKVSKFDDAIRVFRKMQRNGIVPNAYSYGVILNGLSIGGRLVECEEFCVEMFEAGHSPNPATFVGLIDAFCKAKGVEEGERIVKKFQERNFAIDEKSIREHLDKKGPFDGPVWEAIFGRKAGRRRS